MALLHWDLPEVLMELSFVCLLFLFHAVGRNICSLTQRVNDSWIKGGVWKCFRTTLASLDSCV